MAKTILQIAPSEQYFKAVCECLRRHTDAETSLIYVTTNRPYTTVEQVLSEEKIEPRYLFFIDCISRSVSANDLPEPSNCIFLEAPEQITTLSIAINRTIELLPGEKVLLLDSLTTLLIYNSAESIGKFSNFIINKLRFHDVGMILIAVDSQEDREIIRTIESFVDAVEKEVGVGG